jgi:hypothetical protein
MRGPHSAALPPGFPRSDARVRRRRHVLSAAQSIVIRLKDPTHPQAATRVFSLAINKIDRDDENYAFSLQLAVRHSCDVMTHPLSFQS